MDNLIRSKFETSPSCKTWSAMAAQHLIQPAGGKAVASMYHDRIQMPIEVLLKCNLPACSANRGGALFKSREVVSRLQIKVVSS